MIVTLHTQELQTLAQVCTFCVTRTFERLPSTYAMTMESLAPVTAMGGVKQPFEACQGKNLRSRSERQLPKKLTDWTC